MGSASSSLAFLAPFLLTLNACGPEGAGDCDPSTAAEERLVQAWADADEDGYSAGDAEEICAGETLPDGWLDAQTEEDCDDTDPVSFPGAPDLAGDGIDQDCDGEDAEETRAEDIFVSSADPACQEEVAGTREAPNCAIETAGAMLVPGGTMYVAIGEYGFERAPLGRDYFGGLDPETWERVPGQYSTVIQPPYENGLGWAAAFALSDYGDAGAAPESVVQGFEILGSDDSPLSNGMIVAGGSLTASDLLIRGGTVADFGHLETNSSAIWGLGGNLYLTDSTLDGGSSDVCKVIKLLSGDVEITNSVITGCGGSPTGYAVATTNGSAVLTDLEIELDEDVVAGTAIEASGSGRVFITGSLIRAQGNESSIGISVTGESASVQVKNSVILGSTDGIAVTAAASATEGGTLIAASTLFHGGLSAGDESAAILVDDSRITLVNCLVDGGDTVEVGSSAGIRSSGDSELTLVSNNLWGPAQNSLVEGDALVTELESLDDCGFAGCVQAQDNASEDPVFLDLDGGTFELDPGSPFIDAGADPSPFGLVVDRDFDGLPAPSDGDGNGVAWWDIGPYER